MKVVEDWVGILWGLFNYFENGCSASDPALSEATQRSSPWISRHSGHAKNLFNECWKFCRVKDPEGPNRGIAPLLEQLEFARARCYDRRGFIDLDSLAQHTGDVLPHHIFLPDQGAVIDPAEHLRGERLAQFLSTPDWVPELNESASKRPKPCHKV